MKYLLSLLMLCLSVMVSAQSLGMQQIGSLGGELQSGNSPALTHSLGAVASEVLEDNDLRLDQGTYLACDLSCSGIKTGLNDLIYEMDWIQLYPNPATSEVFVEGPSQYLARYELVAPTGQLVSSGSLAERRINLTPLSAGLYLLRVYDPRGQLKGLAKLVKQ